MEIKSKRSRGRWTALSADPNLLLGKPRPLYLLEEFASVGESLRTCGQRTLTHRQQRYVLWATVEGTTIKAIAGIIRETQGKVRKLLELVYDDPGIFMESGFVQRFTYGRNNAQAVWCCRYCCEIYFNRNSAARHAWRHVFDRNDNFPRP